MKFDSDYQPQNNGRPKGSKNKVTQEIRKKFEMLVNNNLHQLDDDLKSLEPKDRVKAITEMAKFVLPTLKSASIDRDNESFQPIEIVFD